VDDSAAYGDYYQWGRAKDGHQSSTSGTVTRSTDIVSGHGHFIHGWADWTDADSSGELRIAAWKDGGKNDDHTTHQQQTDSTRRRENQHC
jgi:hypothetical protein